MTEAPENVPRARLRVIAEPDFAVVDGTPGGDCATTNLPGRGRIVGFPEYQIRKGTFDGRSLGMPDPERLDLSVDMSRRRTRNKYSGEIYVEAGKPFWLSYLYHVNLFTGYRSCATNMFFTPQEGKDYEARFWIDLKEKRCLAVLMMRTEYGLWVPVPMGRC
jgi:hypothetical protein